MSQRTSLKLATLTATLAALLFLANILSPARPVRGKAAARLTADPLTAEQLVTQELAERAWQLIRRHPYVIAALGPALGAPDVHINNANVLNTPCTHNTENATDHTPHLCAVAVIQAAERDLWVAVDLTEERVVTWGWTNPMPAESIHPHPNPLPGRERELPSPFQGEGPGGRVQGGCPDPGHLERAGWSLDHEVTGTDGLRLSNVAFFGEPVLTSAKLVEWHVHYLSQSWGFLDYTGCAIGGSGLIYPYGDTQIADLLDDDQSIIGFEVIQDFRGAEWGQDCEYRYEQHFQFYDDGRFRVVGGAFGRGCDTDAIYRPVMRIDVAAAGDDGDSFAIWDGSQWQEQATEGWWSQAEPYTAEGYKWRVMDTGGRQWYVEPGQGQFGDGGRGDDAFIYVTQHKPEEGDDDLPMLGECCNNDYQQGPEQYLNGESIAGENLVIWYVSQMVTDVTAGSEYCWTIQGEPDPITFPCFSGPLFVPEPTYDVQRLYLPYSSRMAPIGE
ncbi:MAG: hypothetical protein AB1791_09510 [Chloroflexota bacterium]